MGRGPGGSSGFECAGCAGWDEHRGGTGAGLRCGRPLVVGGDPGTTLGPAVADDQARPSLGPAEPPDRRCAAYWTDAACRSRDQLISQGAPRGAGPGRDRPAGRDQPTAGAGAAARGGRPARGHQRRLLHPDRAGPGARHLRLGPGRDRAGATADRRRGHLPAQRGRSAAPHGRLRPRGPRADRAPGDPAAPGRDGVHRPGHDRRSWDGHPGLERPRRPDRVRPRSARPPPPELGAAGLPRPGGARSAPGVGADRRGGRRQSAGRERSPSGRSSAL